MEPNMKLIELRQRKGLMRDQLAAKVNLKNTRMEEIENGIHNPNVLFKRTIAKALDTRPEDIWDDYDPKEPW